MLLTISTLQLPVASLPISTPDEPKRIPLFPFTTSAPPMLAPLYVVKVSAVQLPEANKVVPATPALAWMLLVASTFAAFAVPATVMFCQNVADVLTVTAPVLPLILRQSLNALPVSI